MGAPKRFDERVASSIRLAPDLFVRLDNQAKRRVVGRNVLIEAAIKMALDKWEAEALPGEGA